MKKSIAVILLLAIVAAQSVAFAGDKSPKAKPLTEDQRVIHVLNRLGFGPRPGDVERVKAMGVENYINQQLNPEKIIDTVAEDKVRDLYSLNMSTAALYEKYPQPGQLLRQLQQRPTTTKSPSSTAPPLARGPARSHAPLSRTRTRSSMAASPRRCSLHTQPRSIRTTRSTRPGPGPSRDLPAFRPMAGER